MSVDVVLEFLAKSALYSDERPYCLKFESPAGLRRSNIQVELSQQRIEDIRGHEEDFTIDKNGFALVPLDTQMTHEDFDDEENITSIYLPEAAEALRQLVGAFRVQIFEYVVSALATIFELVI